MTNVEFNWFLILQPGGRIISCIKNNKGGLYSCFECTRAHHCNYTHHSLSCSSIPLENVLEGAGNYLLPLTISLLSPLQKSSVKMNADWGGVYFFIHPPTLRKNWTEPSIQYFYLHREGAAVVKLQERPCGSCDRMFRSVTSHKRNCLWSHLTS